MCRIPCGIMEFPITKQRLQSYKDSEARAADIKQRVLLEIRSIRKDVERIVLTSKETMYIHDIKLSVKYGLLRPNTSPPVPSVGILKELLVAIHIDFPDSAICMDPLETYILIDWSS